MKIPTRMPSGGCILGIGILGVAIREKSRHECLLGVAFWVFAFWGFRFVKIPTRMPSGGCILSICILGVTIRENPDTNAFRGRILGICILGFAIRENPDTYAFWGSHFGYLHSGGCDF